MKRYVILCYVLLCYVCMHACIVWYMIYPYPSIHLDILLYISTVYAHMYHVRQKHCADIAQPVALLTRSRKRSAQHCRPRHRGPPTALPSAASSARRSSMMHLPHRQTTYQWIGWQETLNRKHPETMIRGENGWDLLMFPENQFWK